MENTKINHEWEDAFQSIQERELTQNYGDNWTLQVKNDISDELTLTQKRIGWKVYQTSSFGRFTCSTCHHSWNSARVSLTFHYLLEKYLGGKVYLRLYRQQCRECNNGVMISSSFIRKSIKQEVLKRLIRRIKKNCYNEAVDIVAYHRKSIITESHETTLCEACIKGICKWDA